MGKKKSKLEWLDRALLVSPICYALCLSEKEFHAELKQMKLPVDTWPSFNKTSHANATTTFFSGTKHHQPCAIVTVSPPSKRVVDTKVVHAMLAHEAVHIWREIAKHIGEDFPAAEQEAYAIQRIAQSLMFSYDHQTKKRRKKK